MDSRDWRYVQAEYYAVLRLNGDAQLKPLEGAEAGGVGGFFKGVGKGFVG